MTGKRRRADEMQRAVMLFVQREFARTGFAPTIQAITLACGLSSKSRAHAVIAQLVQLGHLAKTPNITGGIAILKPMADDRFEEAAKAACEATGLGPEQISVVRDAIVAKLMRAA